jgi:hypothetical protein
MMPRNSYDAETKSTILDVVAQARKSNRTWSQAHAVAKKVGYKGGLVSLMLFAGKKGKGKGRGPGRSKGSKAGRRLGRPAKTETLNGSLGAIDQIVSREVQTRINAAARAAIRELKKLIK